MATQRAWLSWSSGKDSAWSLELLRRKGEFEIVALLTTINQQFGRVAMHAVREALVESQAEAAGVPLVRAPIPYPCPNETYERVMAAAMDQAKSEGVTHVAFGDLFLEDIRKYRVEKMAACAMTPIFPVWGINTRDLARQMVEAGVRAFLTCVDPRKLDPKFAGREFDTRLLDELPKDVDPCGENGEFHTFVYDGPMFRRGIPAEVGAIVERDGFVFADVKPR